MKRSVSIYLIFLSCVLYSSCFCKEKPCEEDSSSQSVNINGFDLIPSSPYYNQVIATFKLSQTTSTYNPRNSCSTCPNVTSKVTLGITNTTSNTITFDYNISYFKNYVSWYYQGFVTIGPGSTVDVGEISDNPAGLSGAQISVVSSRVRYR